MALAVLGQQVPGHADPWDQGMKRQGQLGQAGVAR